MLGYWVSKIFSARSIVAMVFTSAVLLLGFSFAFFQNKKAAGPVYAKIIRQRVIKQAANGKKTDLNLVYDKSSAPMMPSQPEAQEDAIEKDVEKQKDDEAFVSIDRLVPKEIFSYEASMPKRADLKWAERSGKKTELGITEKLTDSGKDFGKEKSVYHRLDKIKTNEVEGEFSLALLADRVIADYNSFFLNEPPRFVIDFSGKWRLPSSPELRVGGEIARSVRFGKHSDCLRVVIDLAGAEFEVSTIKAASKELIVTIRKAPHSQISK